MRNTAKVEKTCGNRSFWGSENRKVETFAELLKARKATAEETK